MHHWVCFLLPLESSSFVSAFCAISRSLSFCETRKSLVVFKFIDYKILSLFLIPQRYNLNFLLLPSLLDNLRVYLQILFISFLSRNSYHFFCNFFLIARKFSYRGCWIAANANWKTVKTILNGNWKISQAAVVARAPNSTTEEISSD